MKRGEQLDTHSTNTTVKRIEKIPSKYYIQVPNKETTTQPKKEQESSLSADRKQLPEVLSGLSNLASNYAKNAAAWFKKQGVRLKNISKHAFVATKSYLVENAKRLAFSSAVSVGIVASAATILFSTCSIGCKITINGQVIGTARNASEYAAMVEEINREIAYVSDENFVPAGEPSFSTCIIAKNAFVAKFYVAAALARKKCKTFFYKNRICIIIKLLHFFGKRYLVGKCFLHTVLIISRKRRTK